ncbi:MAG: hypothetical protein ABIH11_05775 [Candidatus Altiarchaeota archaeon]
MDDKFSSQLIKRMEKGEVTIEDARAIGFNSVKELWAFSTNTSKSILSREIRSFNVTKTIRFGKQTDVLIDEKKTFLLKRIKYRVNEGDQLPEKTKMGMILTRRRLGGLVTPFIMYSGNMHGRPEFGEGIAASRITPIALEELRQRKFIDEYMNLMEECWSRGVYNHDFKLDSLGRTQTNELVILDIGLPNDIVDERIFTPNTELFWDVFHIGVDKIHRLHHAVDAVNCETADYFKEKISERWGINLLEGWSRKRRGGEDVIHLAETLRKTVKQKFTKDVEKHHVWPLITPEIEDEIKNLIESRMA